MPTDEKLGLSQVVHGPGNLGIADPHKVTSSGIMKGIIIEPLADTPVFDWDVAEVGGGVKGLGDASSNLVGFDIPP